MFPIRLIAAALLVLATLPATAVPPALEPAPYLILDAMQRHPDAGRALDEGFGGRLGYGFPLHRVLALELGLHADQAAAQTGTGRAHFYGAGLDLRLNPIGALGPLVPFVLAGGGYEAGERINADRVDAPYATLGAGLGWRLSPRSALRIEGRRQASFSDAFDPERDRIYDSRYHLGIEYAFAEPAPSRERPTAPALGFTPAPPPAAPSDQDGDGVRDERDRCPDSAPAQPVDARGCALPPPDADGDGIRDADDGCADTPRGLGVDPRGCAVRAQTLVLRTIGFALDSAVLDPAALGVLDGIAAGLRGQPGMALAIGGHTDDRGSRDYNQALSQARADAVRTYLIAQGVEAARLRATGHGETRPIADNLGEDGWALNRRVEFEVVAP